MSLSRYILKRVIYAIVIMWAVATTIFFGMRMIPGGPVGAMLGQDATQARAEALRKRLGLDQPLHEQYAEWMFGLLQGDLGNSIHTQQEVASTIALALPKTVSIGVLAILIGLAVAIPAGIISATRRHETPDHVATITAFLGLSMPAFYIAILLAVIFGVWLGVLPVFGYNSIGDGIIPWFKSILLPAIAVGMPYAAVVMRMTRSSLLEVMNSQYSKTARAKGVSDRVRLYKHLLQNALIPVVTIAGIQLAVIIGGSVTVEIVFGIKGMGRVIVQSVVNRDYPITQGAILVIAAGLVFINLLVDITYTVIDPRIRYGGSDRGR